MILNSACSKIATFSIYMGWLASYEIVFLILIFYFSSSLFLICAIFVLCFEMLLQKKILQSNPIDTDDKVEKIRQQHNYHLDKVVFWIQICWLLWVTYSKLMEDSFIHGKIIEISKSSVLVCICIVRYLKFWFKINQIDYAILGVIFFCLLIPTADSIIDCLGIFYAILKTISFSISFFIESSIALTFYSEEGLVDNFILSVEKTIWILLSSKYFLILWVFQTAISGFILMEFYFGKNINVPIDQHKKKQQQVQSVSLQTISSPSPPSLESGGKNNDNNNKKKSSSTTKKEKKEKLDHHHHGPPQSVIIDINKT